MKQEIIKKLRSELFEGTWCHNDFEKYDVPSLEASEEPFFWLCYEDGTSLVHIGATAINSFFKSEKNRIAMFQDSLTPISWITYHKGVKNKKCFYWDGYILQQISIEDVEAIYAHLIDGIYKEMCEKYADELAIANKPLEVRFSTPEQEQRYKETLKFAEELEDESLAKCVFRLTQWKRCAVNQYIKIGYDFADKSFSFVDMINEEPGTNGGIIYSKHSQQNRWSIHT